MLFGIDSEYSGDPETYTEDLANFSSMICSYGFKFDNKEENIEVTNDVRMFMASVSYFIAEEFNRRDVFTRLIGDLNFGTRQNNEFYFSLGEEFISSKKLAKNIYSASLKYNKKMENTTADMHCYIAYVAMVCACNVLTGNNFESNTLSKLNKEYIDYLKDSGSFNYFFEMNRRYMSQPRFVKYYGSIRTILFSINKHLNNI